MTTNIILCLELVGQLRAANLVAGLALFTRFWQMNLDGRMKLKLSLTGYQVAS